MKRPDNSDTEFAFRNESGRIHGSNVSQSVLQNQPYLDPSFQIMYVPYIAVQ